MASQVKSKEKKNKHNGILRASSLAEQTDSVRSLSVSSSNSLQRPGSCQQRRGECSCAGYGDHARPSSPPCQEGWPHQCGLLLPCSTAGQTFNELDCFGTPPATRFQGHDNKAAPVASQQLSVFCFLVCPGSFAHVAVHSGSSRPRLSVAR